MISNEKQLDVCHGARIQYTMHRARKYPKAGTASSALLHVSICRGHTTTKLWLHVICSSLQRQTFHQLISILPPQRNISKNYLCWATDLLELTNSTAFVLCQQRKWKWRNSQIVLSPELSVLYNESLLMFHSLSILTMHQAVKFADLTGYVTPKVRWPLVCRPNADICWTEWSGNKLHASKWLCLIFPLSKSKWHTDNMLCGCTDSRTSTNNIYTECPWEMQATTILLER